MKLKEDNKFSRLLVVAKFIWRQNSSVILGTIMATIIVISHVVTANMAELFNGAKKWFNLFYNISLSIIAAFVFYFINIIVPNYKRDMIRESNRVELIKEHFEYMDIFFRDIAIRTGFCDAKDLDSKNFLDNYPCGYDVLFTFSNNKYDDRLYNALIKMKMAQKEDVLYDNMIEKIDELLGNYYDLMNAEEVVMYLKLKESIELLILSSNSLIESNRENEDLINAMVVSLKRTYRLTRNLQASEEIKPQFKKTHFRSRNYMFD